MCALVQHFLCPLSSNIISGVLKSFNSEELQREQLAVNREELQQQWYTKSRVLFVGKVNYNDVSECSILPFEDAIPRASLCYCGQPYLFFRFIYYRSLRSQAFLYDDSMAVPSSSQVSDGPFSRWFDFRSVTYNLALFSRGLLVSTFGVSLSSTLSSWHSPVLFLPDCPRSYLRFHYHSYTSSNFKPFCRLVSRVIELRRLLRWFWW